ncbi:TCP family transcription factor [Musa troglodytarum]|uniref:TCP family transcription factor n=1 Tax=Musa troglodytarum TaxID=320322 RepID=A0A9E7G9D5_9LILI|nr:TCP family transcription factor [Musa troglodytarum]
MLPSFRPLLAADRVAEGRQGGGGRVGGDSAGTYLRKRLRGSLCKDEQQTRPPQRQQEKGGSSLRLQCGRLPQITKLAKRFGCSPSRQDQRARPWPPSRQALLQFMPQPTSCLVAQHPGLSTSETNLGMLAAFNAYRRGGDRSMNSEHHQLMNHHHQVQPPTCHQQVGGPKDYNSLEAASTNKSTARAIQKSSSVVAVIVAVESMDDTFTNKHGFGDEDLSTQKPWLEMKVGNAHACAVMHSCMRRQRTQFQKTAEIGGCILHSHTCGSNNQLKIEKLVNESRKGGQALEGSKETSGSHVPTFLASLKLDHSPIDGWISTGRLEECTGPICKSNSRKPIDTGRPT